MQKAQNNVEETYEYAIAYNVLKYINNDQITVASLPDDLTVVKNQKDVLKNSLPIYTKEQLRYMIKLVVC